MTLLGANAGTLSCCCTDCDVTLLCRADAMDCDTTVAEAEAVVVVPVDCEGQEFFNTKESSAFTYYRRSQDPEPRNAWVSRWPGSVVVGGETFLYREGSTSLVCVPPTGQPIVTTVTTTSVEHRIPWPDSPVGECPTLRIADNAVYDRQRFDQCTDFTCNETEGLVATIDSAGAYDDPNATNAQRGVMDGAVALMQGQLLNRQCHLVSGASCLMTVLLPNCTQEGLPLPPELPLLHTGQDGVEYRGTVGAAVFVGNFTGSFGGIRYTLGVGQAYGGVAFGGLYAVYPDGTWTLSNEVGNISYQIDLWINSIRPQCPELRDLVLGTHVLQPRTTEPQSSGTATVTLDVASLCTDSPPDGGGTAIDDLAQLQLKESALGLAGAPPSTPLSTRMSTCANCPHYRDDIITGRPMPYPCALMPQVKACDWRAMAATGKRHPDGRCPWHHL